MKTVIYLVPIILTDLEKMYTHTHNTHTKNQCIGMKAKKIC